MIAKKRPMNRKPTLRDAQKANTRQRLLDAGRVIFYREGYYAATVDQIVAEAGASRPTFYLHFRDKAQMLDELMAQYATHAAPYMERLPGPRPTIDELKEWLFEVGAFFQEEKASFAVLTEVSARRQNDRSYYGLSTVDAWINALSSRAEAFAAASRKKPDVSARARAEMLIIEIVWVGGNVVRNRDASFTEETVAIVARSLHEFLNDPRFHAGRSKSKKASDGRTPARQLSQKERPATKLS